MRPDQRTKLAVGIYKIFAEQLDAVRELEQENEQWYTEILEELEAYIAEKIG